MTRPKKDAVPKLIPLRVPDVELRKYRRELIKMRLDFLLWDWNCVLATICKEMINKNRLEGTDLRVNPMLWTFKHWTRVLGSCEGKDGDYTFEKESVKVTQAEEFTFAPLFKNPRSSSNERRTMEYCDSKSRAMATTAGSAKRQKVAEASGEGRRLEACMAETEVTWWKTSKRHARPKKKANRKVVISESSECSVAMMEGDASTTDEDRREEVAAQVGGTVVESPEILSPQATKEVVRPEAEMKSSEQEPKELVVTFPDFLQDNVVPLLKYLNGKREKYTISKEEREEHLRTKEMECEVLLLNLAKEKEFRAEDYGAVRDVANKSESGGIGVSSTEGGDDRQFASAGLSKIPHLKLRVSDSDVSSVHEAIRILSKFESGYSVQWAENVQSGKFPLEI
ncbi:hypothetical protein AXG93_955s1070 [Marchantia polymorpha subsp. ruderalis]|uniref:Uncharacterized protein n=1 Tax=Marchantia polymorpha subsp. ruderalis TaxID=1480154 RepID=A0A176WIJ3_MARPO|nr:hypothetical protein AXG93_955s1070 [Marchantia polymorpha subsp. ruderalis]